MQDTLLISSLFVGMAALFSLPLLLIKKEINKTINVDKDIRKFSTDLLSNGWFLVVGPDRKSRDYLNYICKQRGILPQLCFLNMLDYSLSCDQIKIKKWTESFSPEMDIEKTPYFFSVCELRKEKVFIEPLFVTRERLMAEMENEIEQHEENKEAMKEEEEEEEDRTVYVNEEKEEEEEEEEENRFSFLFENMSIGK